MASPASGRIQFADRGARPPGRRSRRRRALRTGAIGLTLAFLAVVLPQVAGVAVPPDPAVSPAVSPANGFPQWYQDSSGVRLQPCLDPNDANCIVTADAGYDPAQPQVFPGNFPSEFFYAHAQSDRLATPGCAGTAPGRISLLDGLEGAFVNGAPAYGEQMVFGRERLILTGGLCPEATYTVTGPYRTFTFTTGTDGALAKNQATTDVGCVPVAPNVCDFSLALGSDQARDFLRWDAAAPAAPAGYLGDGTTLHTITGGTNGNAFSVSGPGDGGPLTLQTDQFSVMGKVAGPLSASPAALDFAGQETGGTSAARTVTVTSLAQADVTVGALTKGGADPDAFTVDNGCTGQVLARDTGSCQLGVTFAPTGAPGPRSARITLGHDAAGDPLVVTLSGTAIQGDVPGIATSVSSVDFGRQRITYSSTDRDITVTNTGTAPLVVNGVSVSGSDSEFSATSHCLTPVPAGGTCSVRTSFAPNTLGDRSATLHLSSNAGPADVALSGTGTGGRAAVSASRDTTAGFPDWYQDEAGVRLQQCIDPNDANCIVLPGGTYTGANDVLSFPGNFPDEYFWTVVDSDTMPTPGCNGSAAGKMLFRFGLEAAFANGDPAPGDQMSFGRIRIRASGGLCPEHTYTAVTPYGTQQVTTDGAGALKPSPNTSDVGCTPTPGVACDFALALRSPVLGGFLRWDPAVAPAAPAGYTGNPTVLHTVVGAPYTPPGASEPANYVALYDGPTATGTPVLRTDKFLVMGKLGGPLVADPSPAGFGSVKVGDPAVSRTITLTNTGADPITVDGLDVGGAAAASYEVGTTACPGTALAPGGSCDVEVRFHPTDQGSAPATLTVRHTGLNSPLPVKLQGVGLAPDGSAALSLGATDLSFAQLHTGRTSPAQKLVVSNLGGTAPLTLADLPITGTNAASFRVAPGTCTAPVAVDGTCTLLVSFAPAAAGPQNATLTVNAAAPSAPSSRTVTLTGTGFAGAAADGPVRSSDGFPAYYQDGNGVRVAPCLEASDPNCAVLAGPGFDPALPLAFPDNYPEEFFFHVADSEPMTVTDAACGASADVSLHEAVEGAFANGGAEVGQQITFGRSRIIVTRGKLCPSTTYTFVTPYGEHRYTTDATGALKRTDATVDIGCGAAPCAFADALAAPELTGLLRWAPGVGAAPPDGHLGDGVTFHAVVGGTYVPAGDTEPVNYFEVRNGAASLGRSAKFSVVGRVATGLVEGPALDLGDVNTGAQATGTVTFTNVGTTPVAVGAARITGAGPAVTVTGGTCAGTTVPGNGTCTVQVRFAPTAAGPVQGRVEVLAPGGAVLAATPVSGTGIVPTVPRISVTPTTLTFAGQRAGSTSAPSVVTVRNTGTAALVLGVPTLGGTRPGDFTATPTGCASVAPGATCQVTVTFRPTATGTRTAVLTLPSNAPGAAPTVQLTGTGTASAIQLRSTTLDFGGLAAGRTSTKSVVVTNSGTAPLSISAVTSSVPAAFTVSRGTCTVAVAPGRNCSISVTFIARAPAGTRSAVVTFTSDAPVAPTLRVTGRVK